MLRERSAPSETVFANARVVTGEAVLVEEVGQHGVEAFGGFEVEQVADTVEDLQS